MKQFKIWHGDGTNETVSTTATPVIQKKPEGLKIKIGKRTIVGAVGFTEVHEGIKIK
jgi:hypothetical protein